MKFCTKCGLKEQDNSAIFCKKCGNKLTSTKYHPKTRRELNELLDRSDVEYSEIDVSDITDMAYLFAEDFADNFHANYWRAHKLKKNTSGLIYWNVSNVRNMSSMFWGAKSFNQPIGNWDVSKVRNMSSMFYGANSFNQPIGDWDVSNVRNMSSMFSRAKSFNQPIKNWDISNVENVEEMFYEATSFDKSSLAEWKISYFSDPFNFL